MAQVGRRVCDPSVFRRDRRVRVLALGGCETKRERSRVQAKDYLGADADHQYRDERGRRSALRVSKRHARLSALLYYK